ncbi:MAG: hypothetical protein ACOYYJ_00040 [Chloroflexota bacterium]
MSPGDCFKWLFDHWRADWRVMDESWECGRGVDSLRCGMGGNDRVGPMPTQVVC